MIATRRREVAVRYLGYLDREIARIAGHLGGRRRVIRHHWGGGTPTYLTPAQIEALHRTIAGHFELDAAAENAIEIDPRVTTREQLQLLRALGFNRLSMGVQDFTPEVQDAIGRRQSEQETRALYDYARAVGFQSINVDLIYGLPRQELAAFTKTLDAVAAMRPDRIAVYSYAHVPWLRPHQKRIDPSALPAAELKFELIAAAIEAFGDAGYVAIGMDHFALPGDELAVAAQRRTLHRNFMGYTAWPATDLIGAGMSAIGDVSGAFAQNARTLAAYYTALDEGRLPIERGYALEPDDLVRRHVITELMCNFHVDCAAVSARFGIDVGSYFAAELAALSGPGGPVEDGFLSIAPDALEVTARGRLFVRNICMHFDRYLGSHAGRPVFSRTI